MSNDIKTGIIKADISDHFPIFLISMEPDLTPLPISVEISKRYFNENSLQMFKDRLHEITWEEVLAISDPNKAYEVFLTKFLLMYDEIFPKVKVKLKRKTLASPWITKGIMKSSKMKQKLYDRFLKNKTYQNETTYKNYRKLFEAIKTKAKKNYYSKIILKYKNDMKNTWKVIKEAIGKKKRNWS